MWQRLAGVAAALALIAAPTAPAAPRPAFAQEPATVDDVLDDPTFYYGQAVSVVGPVGEVLGAHAFTIENLDDLFSDDLLVISVDPLVELASAAAVSGDEIEDMRAWAAGTPRPFAVLDVEREIGIDLDDGLLAEWVGGPVLIATDVTPIDSTPAR